VVFPKEGAQGGPFVLGMKIDEELKIEVGFRPR
jgi:hypothetical protein